MLSISVIMSVYNGERYLRAAIESILGQSFNDFEFIIVNDASTDASAEIINSYSDARIKLIENTTNLGLTRSLNKALSVAKGDYLVRQDADDISYPGRLVRQIDFMEANPAVGLLGAGYDIINWQGIVLDTIIPPATDRALRVRLEETNAFCHGTIVMRRLCLEKVGRYRDDFPVTQDYELWLRMAEYTKIAAIQDVLYGYRFDEDSIGRRKRDQQLSYQCLAIEYASHRRRHIPERPIPEDVLVAYPPPPEKLLSEALTATYFLYASNKETKATEALERAINISKGSGINIDWDSWVLSRANQLAGLKTSVEAGVRLIRWLGERLPSGWGVQRTIAHFFIDQAFIHHANDHKKESLNLALRAIKYDRYWLRNRGVLSIIVKDLLQS
jgi:glycosyltransferase involved in cell wall biosynthesis